MTQKELENKLGAMHLRFLDHEKNYAQLLKELNDYADLVEDYGSAVTSALAEGLNSYERFMNLDNALSPRCIVIEKRKFEKGKRLSPTDNEGLYHVVLYLDDETRHDVKFSRKQEQLLYITTLLSSFKNGMCEEFFAGNPNPYMDVHCQLAKMIYPLLNEDKIDDMIINLDPELYFSESIQKMKAPVVKCAKSTQLPDEQTWFVPYIKNIGRKKIYKMRIPPTKIIYPEEFQPIVDALPDAAKFIELDNITTRENYYLRLGLEYSKDHVDDIRQKAEDGNAVDQMRLGACYMAGAGGLNQDFEQAGIWLLKAAQQGDISAMDMLGTIHLYGYGVEKSQKNAFAWWQKSADLGSAEGLYFTGLFYGSGDIVDQDYKKSSELLKEAADKGHLDAAFQLGIYYMHGFGVEKDIHKAIQLFDMAAEKGHAESANEAGYIYNNGVDGISQDTKKAYEYYLIAAKQDHEEAMWYTINYLLDHAKTKKDYDDIAKWLDKAENLEYYNILLLAGIYFFNLGDDDSLDMALDLFAKCLEVGLPMAYFMMWKFTQVRFNGSPKRKEEEGKKLLIGGAEFGEKCCIDKMKELYPDIYEKNKSSWEKPTIMSNTLKSLIGHMACDDDKEAFIILVDAYREKWEADYLAEMCKQLSIHKPTGDDGEKGDKTRKIIVKRHPKAKGGYEVTFRLANGKELTINKFNEKALMLYLLTIICSMKSGYSTSMAKNEDCRMVMRELIRLVMRGGSDNYLNSLIDQYMWYDSNEKNRNYYKTYSNMAKTEIKKAIGTLDAEWFYVFDNRPVAKRQNLRVMNLEPQFIELTDKLAELAARMPDAVDVLQITESQKDESALTE